MDTLLNPTIEHHFSLYVFPTDSAILQVLSESKCWMKIGNHNRYLLQLVLSDGRFAFCGFVCSSRHEFGTNSILRVIPSNENTIIFEDIPNCEEPIRLIHLRKFVKILGKQTHIWYIHSFIPLPCFIRVLLPKIYITLIVHILPTLYLSYVLYPIDGQHVNGVIGQPERCHAWWYDKKGLFYQFCIYQI